MAHAADSSTELSSFVIEHHRQCQLHQSVFARRCNAKTKRRTTCTRAAKSFPPGALPTCLQHTGHEASAGRCQAIEVCGMRCLRLTVFDPPFHLCPAHEKGTDTLPCHLLKIPIEIRQMIFREVFPDSIPAFKNRHDNKLKEISTSLLLVNRKVHAEAIVVLYGQVPFKVEISSTQIALCFQAWNCTRISAWISQWHRDFQEGSDSPISRALVQKIQNFEVEINIDHHVNVPLFNSDGGGSSQDIKLEEYWLYQTRDTIRKFIELVNRTPTTLVCPADTNTADPYKLIQRLEIVPKFSGHLQHDLIDVMSTVILLAEPFRALTRVNHPVLHDALSKPTGTTIRSIFVNDGDIQTFITKYTAYKLEWESSLSREVTMPLQGIAAQFARREPKVKTELEKIVKFFTDIQSDTAARGDRWVSQNTAQEIYTGFTRPLHLARVAYENRELSRLATVRNAVKERWIKYQTATQNASARMGGHILGMFEVNEANTIVQQNRTAFIFPKVESNRPRFQSDWPELNVELFNRTPSDEDQEHMELYDDREYRYYKKGNRVSARLRTPALVREINGSGPWV